MMKTEHPTSNIQPPTSNGGTGNRQTLNGGFRKAAAGAGGVRPGVFEGVRLSPAAALRDSSETSRGGWGYECASRGGKAPIQALWCVCKRVWQGVCKRVAGSLNGTGWEV